VSPVARLRDDARRVFLAGVRAAAPRAAVEAAIRIGAEGRPLIAGRELEPGAVLRIVALGKAACSMAEAAARKLPEDIFPGPGIAVVNRENRRELPRFRVFATGHPLPDAAGVEAAREVAGYLRDAREGDGCLLLVSGGGSALLPAPAEGITLEDKLETTRLLLASGAGIHELNTVRKHISYLKGGGLARIAQPARLEALIVSDVIGDDLSTIASGPAAPDPTTFEEARRVVERRGLWQRIPAAVRRRIESGQRGELPETPKPGDPLFARARNTIVGGNRRSLEACAREAEAMGYAVRIASAELAGEARDAAKLLASALDDTPQEPHAVLAGGETTVTVRGGGRGGRNQEMALSFALERERRPAARPWAFLSGGTDGRDGPTDAAGGVVDPGTLDRGRKAGLDPEGCLLENDSHAFLAAAGDLLITGPTGTNVADLQVLLAG
jgi:glycerate 2-kinase